MDRVLRGLFDLQPAGEGVAKLVLQVDNLRLHYRIGMTRLQERLKRRRRSFRSQPCLTRACPRQHSLRY